MGLDSTQLDLELIAKHVRTNLEITDWSGVDSVWLTGSFANPDKPIDRPESQSDIDIILVQEDYDSLENQEPIYDGANPETVPVRTIDGTDYGDRTMDLMSGYIDAPDPSDGSYIRLPVFE
ncbi:hypothetical protein [Haloarcula laminariae]|uniref:hypothetical protein n=1 Tax=Haloarcula laminariae TaxID=2961577 RepID=UPI0021C6CBF8|nr:hypothetical protein [Halomicroarcula laminariae]